MILYAQSQEQITQELFTKAIKSVQLGFELRCAPLGFICNCLNYDKLA